MPADPLLLEAFALAAHIAGQSDAGKAGADHVDGVPIGLFSQACAALGVDATGQSSRGWLDTAEMCGLFDVVVPDTTTTQRQPRLSLRAGVAAPEWTPLGPDEAVRRAHRAQTAKGDLNPNTLTRSVYVLLGRAGGLNTKAVVALAATLGLSSAAPAGAATPTASRRGGRERAWTVALDDLLPLIAAANDPTRRPDDGRPRHHVVEGVAATLVSKRLRVFAEKGCSCTRCGAQGSYFAAERSPGHTPWHLNLYARNRFGHDVLMTKDHRVPRSKGGSNALTNFDPMCEPCNAAKAGALP